jgi:hypothetical protein
MEIRRRSRKIEGEERRRRKKEKKALPENVNVQNISSIFLSHTWCIFISREVI